MFIFWPNMIVGSPKRHVFSSSAILIGFVEKYIIIYRATNTVRVVNMAVSLICFNCR